MANGPYPQYPVMGGPSLQSVMGRHRMGIEDAMYAAERQRERQSDLMEKGAKGTYEYDKLLRGFMEAKYANPNLTFWDYASKPSVGAAFRKQGRDKIAKATLAGEEIEGMGIGARHKAGLKGIFGRDRPKKGVPYNIETKRIMDEAELSGVGAEEEFARREAKAISKAKSVEEQKLLMEALEKKNIGKGARTTMAGAPYEPEFQSKSEAFGFKAETPQYDKLLTERKKAEALPELNKARIASLKDALKSGKLSDTETALFKKEINNLRKVTETEVVSGGAPVESIAKQKKIYEAAVEKAGGPFKYEGKDIKMPKEFTGKTVAELFGKTKQGEFAYDSSSALNYAQQRDVWKAGGGLQKAVEVAPGAAKAVTETAVKETATKAGLKATLGKAVGPALSAASLAGGLYTMKKGKTEEARIGGGIAAVGGAAGLVAATNFWNPVGWAAAVPAALSVAGGVYGATGGKSDPLSRTPLGRYRRRIGII